MAYCSASNVTNEFKSITFDSNTPVTSSDIAEFIAQIDAYIDGKLYFRYTTPITGANSLLILKSISTYLVASRVSKILELKTGETDKNQLVIDKNKKDATNMLKEIFDGSLVLSDATLRSANCGVYGYTYDNDVEASVNVTDDQW